MAAVDEACERLSATCDGIETRLAAISRALGLITPTLPDDMRHAADEDDATGNHLQAAYLRAGAIEIERLRRITTATLRILSASPDTPDIRDQLAAVIWESGYADTDAPGRITWPKLLEIAEDHAAWCQHRDRALRQADTVLALPSIKRLFAVEAAARPCVAEITTYEEREALRRALSQ
jgi:hypothetical protein